MNVPEIMNGKRGWRRLGDFLRQGGGGGIRLLYGLCCLGCLSFGLVACAADIVWCGADGGSFTNAVNWVGGVKPGASDVCVFCPSGSLSVVVPNGANYATGLRFESGETKFSLEGAYAYTGFASVTGTVKVAEGATFTMDTVRIEQKNRTYRKTGKGTWVQKGQVCWDTSSSSSCELLVEEGLLDFDTYLKVDRLVVSEDAQCVIRGYYRVGGACAVQLDGSLDISTSDTPMLIAGLTGSGIFSASNPSPLNLAPSEDCTFSGRFTGSLKFILDSSSSGRFTVGRADTLAAALSVEAGDHLRFASGVGTFVVPRLTVPTGETVRLEDAAGQPVTLLATRGMTLTGRALTGSGQFAVSNKTTEATLTLGDGTTDAELSDFGALGAYGKGKLVYQNAQPLVQSAALVGNGAVSVGSPSAATAGVTLKDFRPSGGTTTLYAPLTIDGGDAVTAFPGFSLKAATTLTINGGLIGWLRASAADKNYRTIPVPCGLIFGSVAGAAVVQNGGWLYHDGTYNAAARRYELRGGHLALTAPLQPAAGATTESPCVYLLDGGTFGPSLNNVVSELFKSGTDENGKDCSGRIRVQVGAQGARLASFNDANLANSTAAFNLPLEPETEGADGGVTVCGPAAYSFSQPIRLSGDVCVQGGGIFLPDAADTATTPRFFGDGSFRLRNAPLVFQACTTDKGLKLATGEGKGVSYAGASAIRFRRAPADANLAFVEKADGYSRQTLVSGPLTRAGKGSVLFLWDGKDGLVGQGSGASSYTVAGGVALAASGAVAQPILGATSAAFKFLTYDEAYGFRPYEGEVAFAGETTAASVARIAADAALEGGAAKTVGALGLGATLTLRAGSRLTVGDGTNPALVAIDDNQFVFGPGTLDFGASEGVVCVTRMRADTYCADLRCTLAGTGGITFASVPDSDLSWRRVRVSGANAYSGGTFVNAVRLEVAHAEALGTGTVHVGGGARFGGRVAFDTALTVANDFRLAGAGIRDTKWDGFHNQGACEFNADVTLSGDVELVEPARVVIPTAEKTVTFAGTVSGDALEVLKTGTSKLLLTGHNTYTGGTEVVSSILALMRAEGAGTGRILLDAGTLRFENTEAITFTNAVEGVGTIVLAGTAPVTFEGAWFADLPFATFAAGTAIDLASPADSVYVPFFMGDTDLGGRSLTVGGVAGSGRVSSGVLTVTGEISPAGEGAVGTLAFAAGTLVSSGATYVCDVADGAADRLVVGGDFDLSTLKFRAVRCGRARGVSPTVLEAEGRSLSGAFASVALARDAWKVAYGERTVNLDLNAGLLFLVK